MSPTPRRAALALLFALAAAPAAAHVKWFAPYIVNAEPRPVAATLANPWFWTGIGLVLAFFIATRLVEESRLGLRVRAALDGVSAVLWARSDQAMRAMVAGFFVAIFAVGGVYLTPDLQTPAPWVSWSQLVIAALIFWRRLQPWAGLGILLLWALALRDYDLFHLLDYLALGVGVAGYLILEAVANPRARSHRWEVLRWGVAIALMWSSLEKFAFPEWFYPLVEERPFLTFGLPRDVFIPMAGVAEFTLGFGLLWTPLVRRLSAIALFAIFVAAVYPFGRVDFVGHALIMAALVAIAADPEPDLHFWPALRMRIAAAPPSLAAALVVVATGYWGFHRAFYAPYGDLEPPDGYLSTHSQDPERPHEADGTSPEGEAAAPAEGAAPGG